MGSERLRGGLLGGDVVARLEVRVGLAGQRLHGLAVARIDLAERGEGGRGAAPVLLILAHDGGLKGDVLGVGPVLVALAYSP